MKSEDLGESGSGVVRVPICLEILGLDDRSGYDLRDTQYGLRGVAVLLKRKRENASGFNGVSFSLGYVPYKTLGPILSEEIIVSDPSTGYIDYDRWYDQIVLKSDEDEVIMELSSSKARDIYELNQSTGTLRLLKGDRRCTEGESVW